MYREELNLTEGFNDPAKRKIDISKILVRKPVDIDYVTIYKNGDPNKKVKTIECGNCGCIFTDGLDENSGSIHYCPWCGDRIYYI